MSSRYRASHVLALVLMIALLRPAFAASPPDAAFDRMMATARVLSDAVARLGSDHTASAAKARAMLADAETARAAGAAEQARALLETAYRQLRDEVRVSAETRNVAAPLREAAPAAQPDAGYRNRRESALELRKALVRVAAEKGRTPRTLAEFDAALAQADAQAGAGHHAEAARRLGEAYDTVKREVVELRSGDTLVRSLSFSTPEQEFRYELDRNETFSMLVTLLGAPPADDGRAAVFMAKARELRGAADAAGSRGEFVEGIRLLEDSTREYQKLIRNAGILIPG